MHRSARNLIDALLEGKRLSAADFLCLVKEAMPDDVEYARQSANRLRMAQFGKAVYIRGLVEFTNFCRCDCLYCGIRRSNTSVRRYRLTKEQILECQEHGYQAGFRTLVLQGGEDSHFNDDRMCDIVSSLKAQHPDCAITLSLGERSRESYSRLRQAGADRYLLRHETADSAHFARLHPSDQRLETRMECLTSLKELGFQVGCGMMIGSPYQTPECLAQDLFFMQEFRPHMVGLGPFIPHHATPFAAMKAGSVEETLKMLAYVRLTLPKVLLPATTALATLHPEGRIQGILSGANVVMPNLSPVSLRNDYSLYDNKANTGLEAVEGLALLSRELSKIGCCISIDRGDAPE